MADDQRAETAKGQAVGRKRKAKKSFRPLDRSITASILLLKCFGGPNGIRTRVTDVRGRCPNH